jgi:hypothetical protein
MTGAVAVFCWMMLIAPSPSRTTIFRAAWPGAFCGRGEVSRVRSVARLPAFTVTSRLFSRYPSRTSRTRCTPGRSVSTVSGVSPANRPSMYTDAPAGSDSMDSEPTASEADS